MFDDLLAQIGDIGGVRRSIQFACSLDVLLAPLYNVPLIFGLDKGLVEDLASSWLIAGDAGAELKSKDSVDNGLLTGRSWRANRASIQKLDVDFVDEVIEGEIDKFAEIGTEFVVELTFLIEVDNMI